MKYGHTKSCKITENSEKFISITNILLNSHDAEASKMQAHARPVYAVHFIYLPHQLIPMWIDKQLG